MSHRPKPLYCTEHEGGFWKPFLPQTQNGYALTHPCGLPSRGVDAILFSNGWVLDTYNGWRPDKKTKEQMKEIKALVEARNGSSNTSPSDI